MRIGGRRARQERKLTFVHQGDLCLEIEYPGQRLRLVGQTPASQEGFEVAMTQGALQVDATFEGRLVTCFDFCEQGDDSCGVMAPECTTTVTP
jgi:hypothetical protein